MRKKSPPLPWKLYFVTDHGEFECDFIVAKSEPSARRVFRQTYGHDECDIDLVTVITKPPEWLDEPEWLGPDPDLTVFGGKKLLTIDFPRWEFDGEVWGCTKTPAERYTPLGPPSARILDLDRALKQLALLPPKAPTS